MLERRVFMTTVVASSVTFWLRAPPASAGWIDSLLEGGLKLIIGSLGEIWSAMIPLFKEPPAICSLDPRSANALAVASRDVVMAIRSTGSEPSYMEGQYGLIPALDNFIGKPSAESWQALRYYAEAFLHSAGDLIQESQHNSLLNAPDIRDRLDLPSLSTSLKRVDDLIIEVMSDPAPFSTKDIDAARFIRRLLQQCQEQGIPVAAQAQRLRDDRQSATC